MLTLTLLSHMSLVHFKPLNIFRTTTTTQTVEAVAKMKQEQLQIIYRRQA